MKARIQELLAGAVTALSQRGILPAEAAQQVQIERARDSQNGDFAANIAMVIAKSAKRPPREIAEELVGALPPSEFLDKVAIAGPGFINFFVAAAAYHAVLGEIAEQGDAYGHSKLGGGQKILVEFVSANPTGPLHVGHGRGAAYGDAVARILRASGYAVECEYYVNDAGRQMHILALSVWLRYLQILGSAVEFPANGYQGDYVKDIAAALMRARNAPDEKFQFPADAVYDARTLFENLPPEAEARMDELIARGKKVLGDAYADVFAAGRDAMVECIQQDLDAFGVRFENWFSEQTLVDGGAIAQAQQALQKNNYLYEKDGARWFQSTAFGDEKDRAVARADGSPTYFAADIAYHFNKGARGFDKLLNVFGADHHGYARRITAAYQALGFSAETLAVRLVQFAVLYRDGQKVSMSTRGGDFVTLRELYEEVGADAARFFYVSRKNDQHMDFDLELAKRQSAENPVFYIQYAHARICSVFGKLAEQKKSKTPKTPKMSDTETGAPNYELLTEPAELALMKTLSRFPEVVEQAARDFEPHLLAYYLRELAHEFHSYYNAHPFLSSEAKLRTARLGLLICVRQVIHNGLALLGVRAPEKMPEKM